MEMMVLLVQEDTIRIHLTSTILMELMLMILEI